MKFGYLQNEQFHEVQVVLFDPHAEDQVNVIDEPSIAVLVSLSSGLCK